jgi:O-antigen ligase
MSNKYISLESTQFLFFVLLIVFQLFGWAFGVNLFISLLAISIFFNPNFKSELTYLAKNKFFLFSLIPFLLYTISLLYTSELNEGLKNISTKLPLLIFPILFNFFHNSKEEDLWNIAKVFVWGVALMGVLGFFIQYKQFVKTGDSGFFYNDNFGSAFEKQAVYFAWYINSAICILLLGWKKLINEEDRFSFFGILLLLILIGSQILLASRTSIALMFLIFIFVSVYKIYQGISKKKLILLTISISIIIISTVIAFPKVLNRFKSLTQITYKLDNPNPLNHFNGTYSKDNWDGLSARLAIWECTWSAIIKQPFFGCGVGDVEAELQNVYKKKHFILGQKNNFNTHNQFLDLWLSTGIFGLIIISLLLFFFLKYLMKQKDFLLFILWIVLLISMMTENIFNRNQGVMMVGILLGVTVKIIQNRSLNKP